jgi:hypothetical protein
VDAHPQPPTLLFLSKHADGNVPLDSCVQINSNDAASLCDLEPKIKVVN